MNTTTTSATTLCPEHGIVSPVHTKTAGRPGPFTRTEAEEFAASLGSSIMILGIIRENDGWYVSYAQKSTTTLCPDYGIVNPRKAKTHTITTEGYPEAGPFETQSEAMGAFVPPLKDTVLSVEHRDDGWYRTYMVNSTTSTYRAALPWGPEYKSEPWWRRIIVAVKNLIKRGRARE